MPNITSEIVLVKSEQEWSKLHDVAATALLVWINADIKTIRETTQPGNVISKHFNKERTWFSRTMKKLITSGFATYEKVITSDTINHCYHVANMQHGKAEMQHGKSRNATWEKQKNAQILPEVASTSTPHVANLAPSILVKDTKEERESAGAREEIEVENGFAPYKKNHTKFCNPLTSKHENEYAIREFLQENYLNKLPRTPKQWAEANLPGVMAWVTVTQEDFDWYQAPLINQRLGQNPDKDILRTVWENWTGYGYRKSSIGKMLDWYAQLIKDPTATPWTSSQGAKTNDRHSRVNGQAKEGWHGLATSTDKPGSGSKPDIAHLNLPPLILDD